MRNHKADGSSRMRYSFASNRSTNRVNIATIRIGEKAGGPGNKFEFNTVNIELFVIK